MSKLAADIVATIITYILTILGNILCIYFCKYICCDNKNNDDTRSNKINKSSKKVTLVSSIVFLLYIAALNISMLRNIIYHAIGFENGDDIQLAFDFSIVIFYLIGILGIVLVFILRIVYTLNSVSSYSKNVIKILCISFAVNIIEVLLFLILFGLGARPWTFVVIFIFIIHYLSNYIACFILFIKKVFQMMRYKIDNYQVSISKTEQEMTTMNPDENSEKDRVDNVSDNDAIFEIGSIDLLIRYSLLVLTGFVSTFLLDVMGVIVRIITTDIGANDFDVLSFRIDIFVNMLCIYLLFGFAKGLYYKICVKCDRCLKKLVLSKILKSDGGGNDGNKLDEEQTKMLLFETV